MTYYSPRDYYDHYVIRFNDILGSTWTIRIAATTPLSGDPINLTAASDPFTVHGGGTEDQTKCLMGSTASLRIIVTEDTPDLLFSLLPTTINDRRITVFRGSTIMWRGFLAMNTYTQPLRSTPYEIELSCIGFIELCKLMPMPPYDDLSTMALGNSTDVAGALRFIRYWSGLEFGYLCTNYAIYKDLNNTYDSGDHHWTQSEFHLSYFYDDDFEPKKMSDVLEHIFYPYGKLTDVGANLFAYLSTANSNLINYRFHLGAGQPENTLVQAGIYPIATYTLLTNLTFTGTDNTLTHLNAPGKITFKRKEENNNTHIFSFDEKIVKPGYWAEINYNTTHKYSDGNGNDTYYQAIDSKDTDWSRIMTNLQFSSSLFFVRIVSATSISGMKSYVDTQKGSFALLQNTASADPKFDVRRKVLSRKGYNMIKMTIKSTDNKGAGCDKTLIYLRCDGKKLNKVTEDGTTTFVFDENGGYIHMKDLPGSVGNRIVYFNEPRENGDKSLKSIFIQLQQQMSETGDRAHTTITLEYVPYKIYSMDSSGNIPSLTVLANNYSTYQNRIINPDGIGEELSIEFPTMCGDVYSTISGTAEKPYRSMCNSTDYIDTLPRIMLDITSCRFNGDSLFPVNNWVKYSHMDRTFIPISVGFSARRCNLTMKLVSTNI